MLVSKIGTIVKNYRDWAGFTELAIPITTFYNILSQMKPDAKSSGFRRIDVGKKIW